MVQGGIDGCQGPYMGAHNRPRVAIANRPISVFQIGHDLIDEQRCVFVGEASPILPIYLQGRNEGHDHRRYARADQVIKRTVHLAVLKRLDAVVDDEERIPFFSLVIRRGEIDLDFPLLLQWYPPAAHQRAAPELEAFDPSPFAGRLVEVFGRTQPGIASSDTSPRKL